MDPDGYLQIPSHHDMEGQEQDGMEVCGWHMKYTQSFVFSCSCQGQEWLQSAKHWCNLTRSVHAIRMGQDLGHYEWDHEIPWG